MATATKSKRKTAPKVPALGSSIGRKEAEQIQQLKTKWLRHQIHERLANEDGLVSPVARDMGIELTGDFFTAPILEMLTLSQLEQLAELSGVDLPVRSKRTKYAVVAALMEKRQQLVIPREIASL